MEVQLGGMRYGSVPTAIPNQHRRLLRPMPIRVVNQHTLLSSVKQLQTGLGPALNGIPLLPDPHPLALLPLALGLPIQLHPLPQPRLAHSKLPHGRPVNPHKLQADPGGVPVPNPHPRRADPREQHPKQQHRPLSNHFREGLLARRQFRGCVCNA